MIKRDARLGRFTQEEKGKIKVLSVFHLEKAPKFEKTLVMATKKRITKRKQNKWHKSKQEKRKDL